MPHIKSHSPIVHDRLGTTPIIPSRRAEWKLEFKLSDGIERDPCTDTSVATMLGILISARESISGAVLISPDKGEPGVVYQCSIMQRQENIIVRGNTYQVRIQQVDVYVSKLTRI